MGLAQYNGKADLSRARKWYGGTSVLKIGHAVAYDVATHTDPATAADPTHDELGVRVIDPATANLGAFAGVVDSVPSNPAATSVGGGPGWIDIIKPVRGDVLDVWTNVNCTKLTTTLGITNAGGNIFVSVTDATINVDLICVCLQTVDRSSTNGYVRVKFI